MVVVFTKAKVKAHSLTGRITPPLMREAFRAVKRNRGAAGIDQVSIQMYERNLDANLDSLMRQLKDGSYRPQALRRVLIPKDPQATKFRPLGIPAVRDRVAQEVVRRLLTPIFEPLFHPHSFGFRPKRNCHQAVEQVRAFHREGYTYVLDADIQGFFDNLPHQTIMAAVAAQVADGNILRLVEKFLRAGVVVDGVFQPTTVGTPQGGLVSPLLANIVLNYLDWQLEDRGYRFVRYADDFVVLCRTRAQAEAALKLVSQVLPPLGLSLSPDKTKIANFQEGFAFLGFQISSRGCSMRAKSVEKFKAKVRVLTARHRNLDAKVIVKLNQVIRGTAQYFATRFSTVARQFQRLDRWLRMRLRCMKLKRKSARDNYKLRRKYFQQLGLLRLQGYLDIHYV
jgi:group II intron reverse transcriptase/maturase